MADQTNPPQPPPSPPPPRPGDVVPDSGLDPTQVFATPPPPPGGTTGQQAQTKGGAGNAAMPPVKDTSPPPPPVGVQATKEMGYDDEDIKILTQVGNFRFGSISSTLNNADIVVPAHPETTFDADMFLTLLRGSISLTRDEKWRIIQAIPKLSQFQIDELQKILVEEKQKFSELSPKHLQQLMKLEQKHSEDWKDLQSIMRQKGVKQEEASQVDDIRKQLGL